MIILFTRLFCFLLLATQIQDIELQKSFELKADYITVDNINRIYAVSNDQLLMYSEEGKLLRTYNNKSLGTISHVDVSNPLKILVFYKDFGQLVFLDNTLSATGTPIDLNKIGIEEAALSCSSVENNFWIYDARNTELLRLNNELKTVQQSSSIIQTMNYELFPEYLFENNNYVYLNDPDFGIMIFDRYGSFYKKLPFKGINIGFQAIGNTIVYSKGNVLYYYNHKTFEEMKISLPIENVQMVFATANKIYVLSDSELFQYTLKERNSSER